MLQTVHLGESAGEQLLAPWMAIVAIVAGIAVLWWTARRVRRMLMALIARAS